MRPFEDRRLRRASCLTPLFKSEGKANNDPLVSNRFLRKKGSLAYLNIAALLSTKERVGVLQLVFSMFLFLSTFLCSVLFCSRWPSVAEAKLFANCTFGEVKTSQDNNKTSARMITITGQLPSSRGGNNHSCVVTTDNLNSVSYLRAKRNKESKKGEQSSYSQRTITIINRLATRCTLQRAQD